MSYLVTKTAGAALLMAALMAAGCRSGKQESRAAEEKPKQTYPTVGSVERTDRAIDELIAPDAKIEQLAEGFDWSEGPVWMKRGEYLLFSDVPKNVVHKWKEGEGITEFLKPSGYTGSTPRSAHLDGSSV